MRDKNGGVKAGYGERLNREEGTVIKDWGGRLPVALAYPNSYYLGMSNLGVHAIYRWLNARPDVVCERVFHEGDAKDPPLSVESRRPLADFAVIAFSVSYELDYFNIPAMLRNSRLPVYAADRDERHPLVIAGGPCVTANPAPLSPFFDALCIGEAEPLLPEIMPVLAGGAGGRRDELLQALAKLPGVYVPSIPPESPVARQWAKSLDDFAVHSVVLTPDTELGDLFLIEAERGCPHGCRFCLVNTTFAPMRFRSADNIIGQAEEGLRYRRRIGLVGPAVSDHPQIIEILARLRGMGAGLAVSSLRIGSLSGGILEELARGNAQTVTIAPEAGAERLRRLINKGITEDDILAVVDKVAGLGLRQLKLYFMLGLPTETDEEAEEITRLSLAIKERLDRRKSSTRLSINVSPFVPKAGTPFQWLPMAPPPDLNHRLSDIKRALSPKGVRVKAESPAWSRVQGVLSRGDAQMAGAIAGIREVSLAGWRRAAGENQLDIDYYVNQAWGTGQKLPWGMIDSGTATERLCAEMEKALLA